MPAAHIGPIVVVHTKPSLFIEMPTIVSFDSVPLLKRDKHRRDFDNVLKIGTILIEKMLFISVLNIDPWMGYREIRATSSITRGSLFATH